MSDVQPSYLRLLRAFVDQGKQATVLLTEEEIDAFAAELDKDGDGEISYDEFIAAMNKREKEANKEFFKLRRSQLGLAGSDVIGTAVKHTETALKASR